MSQTYTDIREVFLKKMSAGKFSSQAHVLLVEDDVSAMDISKFILQQDGHTVTIACNGRDALVMLNGSTNSSNPISLVITDLTMPVMSGMDFILEMRKRDYSMPVVVTTGCIESYSEPEIQKMGADHILIKPFNPTDLTDCVKTILARKLPRPDGPGYGMAPFQCAQADVSSIAPCATEEGLQFKSPGQRPGDE
jgi:DNA-binding response OmpR family regulator